MAHGFGKLEQLGTAADRRELLRTEKDAVSWFQSLAASSNESSLRPSKIMNDKDAILTSRFEVGKLYFFAYDPKLKDSLPYYDTFPIVFPLGPAKGGWLGLNMHYLPPVLRMKLMIALEQTANRTDYNYNKKLQISYSILKGAAKFNAFKPCVKHYLSNHVQTKFRFIPPEYWQYAALLPIERFKKKNKQYVWNESQKIIGGR